jgi:LEA14-like dessication related protein
VATASSPTAALPSGGSTVPFESDPQALAGARPMSESVTIKRGRERPMADSFRAAGQEALSGLRPIVWVVAVLGCTPLGLWVYDDPQVSVSRVRLLAEASAGTPPVLVALDVKNPNDYPVTSARVELRLRLDGMTVGRLAQDSAVSFPKQATSTFAVALDPSSSVGPARLRTFGSGKHRFAVDGRTTFTTPFGKRKVRFAQEGEMTFGQPTSSASGPAGPGE